MAIVPIRGLFEAHLTVSDLDRSIAFYRDVLGLPLAQRIPARQVAFFWVPSSDKAMLGLWCIGTSPLRLRLHIAFDVALPQVFESVAALRRAGIRARSGDGVAIEEPEYSAGCRRRACISTIRMAIRWSSSACWTNRPDRSWVGYHGRSGGGRHE